MKRTKTRKRVRTLDSSWMALTSSDKRSKHSIGSGGCWGAEAAMDSSCAARTESRDSGTLSLSNRFAIAAPPSERMPTKAVDRRSQTVLDDGVPKIACHFRSDDYRKHRFSRKSGRASAEKGGYGGEGGESGEDGGGGI